MNGFLSYSHDDYAEYLAFRPHLRAFERQCGITVWTDHAIHTGATVDPSIAAAIAAADVFVLFTTPNFIASDYVYDVELPAIDARVAASGALVLPVVVKRCAYQLAAKSWWPAPNVARRVKPVWDWKPRDDGFNQAREEMTVAVQRHFGGTP